MQNKITIDLIDSFKELSGGYGYINHTLRTTTVGLVVDAMILKIASQCHINNHELFNLLNSKAGRKFADKIEDENIEDLIVLRSMTINFINDNL
jgi:hypothetical protein